jgi:mono/diheme cytochrome c family protein
VPAAERCVVGRGRRAWAIACALALALAVSACGGGDDTGGGATTGEGVWTEAGCGNCHTLSAANATGAVGPNLDEARPAAEQVAQQVRSGGDGMPAFEDSLTAEQIDAVARFVAESAGASGSL